MRRDLSDATRIRIGRVFATTAALLSVAGFLALAIPGRWDALVGSGALNFAWIGVGLALLTLVLISSQPRNASVWAVAWSSVFAGLATAGVGAAVLFTSGSVPDLTYDVMRALTPADLPRPAAFALHLRFWAVVPAITLPITLGLLLFPNGKPPTPRWQWVGWWSVTAIAVATVATALAQNPWSTLPVSAAESTIDTPIGWWIDVGMGLALVSGMVSAASLVRRYRRSSGVTKGQIRWIAWGGGIVVLLFVLSPIIDGAGATTATGALVGVLGSSVIMAAYGIAITRHRLYDIDVVINRTIVYGSLVAFITAVFALVVFLPFLVFGASESANTGQLALPLVATVVLVIVFQPVRARLQKTANRLVYGARATPYEALSEFSATVRETPADEDLLARMAGIVSEGTGAVEASVWVVGDAELRQAATHPPESSTGSRLGLVDNALPPIPNSDVVIEVTHQGDLLGALSIVTRQGEALRPIEERLLGDLATQAGVVLRNFRLTDELLHRLDELQASRQRLVAAQDEERRRLERDLHDGAQQQLVALKIKLGMLQMVNEPERRAELVTALVGDTDDAIDALRDLARGIYPPTLAQEGLVSALRAQAAKAIVDTNVEASGVGRYSSDIEAAVYFCTLEAMQNVAKYAEATSIDVRLASDNGSLEFEVRDDGRGFDPAATARGAGLNNMEDRVEALGGRLSISSTPGSGTSISGSIPAASLSTPG
jgi:signal transduction histidine kinase